VLHDKFIECVGEVFVSLEPGSVSISAHFFDFGSWNIDSVDVHHHGIFKRGAVCCHLPVEQVKTFGNCFEALNRCISVPAHTVDSLERDFNGVVGKLEEWWLFEFFLANKGCLLLHE